MTLEELNARLKLLGFPAIEWDDAYEVYKAQMDDDLRQFLYISVEPGFDVEDPSKLTGSADIWWERCGYIEDVCESYDSYEGALDRLVQLLEADRYGDANDECGDDDE